MLSLMFASSIAAVSPRPQADPPDGSPASTGAPPPPDPPSPPAAAGMLKTSQGMGTVSRETLEVVCVSQKCGHTGCTAGGRWVPVLCLRSQRTGTAAPARVELPVAVCDAHRGGIDDYLSDHGWRVDIGAMFIKAGLPKPVRHLSFVDHVLVPGR